MAGATLAVAISIHVAKISDPSERSTKGHREHCRAVAKDFAAGEQRRQASESDNTKDALAKRVA